MTTPTIRDDVLVILDAEFDRLNEIEQEVYTQTMEAQAVLQRVRDKHTRIMRAMTLLERTIKEMTQINANGEGAA